MPKLFRTPVFQGETTDIGDSMFWAPLIAVHHGLREEEALQLRLEDVQAENGIDYFDIKVGASWQRLKSKAATRHVPIHQNLIALGFLDLVDTHTKFRISDNVTESIKLSKFSSQTAKLLFALIFLQDQTDESWPTILYEDDKPQDHFVFVAELRELGFPTKTRSSRFLRKPVAQLAGILGYLRI